MNIERKKKKKKKVQLNGIIVADTKTLVSQLPCMRDSGNSDIQKPLRNLVLLDFKVQIFFQCCHVLLFTFYSYLQQGILSQVQKDVFSLVSSHFINCSSEYLPALVICSQQCLLPTCTCGDFEGSWQQKADCRLRSGHNIAPISIALPHPCLLDPFVV